MHSSRHNRSPRRCKKGRLCTKRDHFPKGSRQIKHATHTTPCTHHRHTRNSTRVKNLSLPDVRGRLQRKRNTTANLPNSNVVICGEVSAVNHEQCTTKGRNEGAGARVDKTNEEKDIIIAQKEEEIAGLKESLRKVSEEKDAVKEELEEANDTLELQVRTTFIWQERFREVEKLVEKGEAKRDKVYAIKHRPLRMW